MLSSIYAYASRSLSWGNHETISSCLWKCRQGVSLSTTCSLDVHWLSFSPPPHCRSPGMDVQGVLLSINSNMDVQGVSLYTANRMDMQVVTIATARSVDVQCAWCMPFHCQQYGLAGCVPFLSPAVWMCRLHPFFKCRNVRLSGIQSLRYRN
jgi:hypothetical protein